MKKQIISKTNLLLCILICITTLSFSQVGINTITPANGSILDIESTDKGIFIPRVSIADLTSIAPITGIVGAAQETAAAGLIVYNTNTTTGPGLFNWNGTDWTAVGGGAAAVEPPIDSISLATDESTTTAAYTAIPGMTLTFTARKANVLVNLTASGFGNTANDLHTVYFRVVQTNPGPNTPIGGTKAVTKSRSGRDVIPEWNTSFSKLMTGLTIGNSYTLIVEWGLTGTAPFAEIEASTFPDEEHLTLSVIQ